MPPTQDTEEICTYNMNFIVQNSNKLLQKNQLIRNHLYDFANHQAQNIQDQLVAQAGQINLKSTTKNVQDMPYTDGKKDPFSFRSVRTIKSAAVSPTNRNKQVKRSRVFKNKNLESPYSPLSKRGRAQNSTDNKFIKLKIGQNENNGKKTTRAQIQEMELQDKLRNKKAQDDIRSNKILEMEKGKQQMQEKQFARKIFFQKQLLKRKRNSQSENVTGFTTDLDGNIIFYEQKQAKNKYPPSISFNFEEQDQPILEPATNFRIKEKAARGEAFASAVLKTMNVSRISLNLGNTANIDHYTYMKRNDLFNNNHTRQVTTIPYLQMTEGVSFKQTNTNLSVSKKNTQRTYHSQMKSNFKTHNQVKSQRQNKNIQNQNSCELNKISASGDLRMHLKKNKRSQSSRTYRPKSCVPQTARTAGRITSFNQELVSSLLE